MDKFLSEVIQFCSSNATELLTSHSMRRVTPQHRDCYVTTDYRDVTSAIILKRVIPIYIYHIKENGERCDL